MKVSGSFAVKLHPLPTHAQGNDGINLGHRSIDKTFHGPLQATSQGQMLSAVNNASGSAGYVAIEQVTGSLDGRSGSFVLQHFGVMAGGQNRLVLEVLPDSGTGELRGLSGNMVIRIESDQHFYDFDYHLDAAAP